MHRNHPDEIAYAFPNDKGKGTRIIFADEKFCVLEAEEECETDSSSNQGAGTEGWTRRTTAALLYRFGGVMLIVIYSVTGCVDRPASSPSISRTQGKSARELLN